MDLETVFDGATLTADLALAGPSLAAEGGLKTAVILSLFTDRRAHPDDGLPDDDGFKNRGTGDRHGWWGDHYQPQALQAIQARLSVTPAPVDRIGSRLWLLSREKQTQAVVARAKEYAEEALAWLTDNAIAESVDVLAEISRPSVLGLQIMIARPSGARESHRFDFAWAALAGGR